MDDGQAYNRTYYGFGSEWHYEPKLHLCQEEEAVLQQIFGKFVPERGSFYYQLLKYGVIPIPWIARRSNQSILKEISPECSLEGLVLKLKLQYFGHLMAKN